MQADSPMRPSPRLSLLLALLVIAGCGTGEGPTPIPGNPAPPLPDGFCDVINFESACGPFDFINFGGGSSSTTVNPKRGGLNTTEKVAKMQKFADQTFGGSRLDVRSGSIDFTQGGEAFTMKVWASREVAVTFKLEGLGRERVVDHSGGETWEALCFDFTGDTAGNPVDGITFIFDNGERGDAENDPDAWTFYFDEIEQVESCPAPPPLFPVDFEGDPASYDFGRDEPGFGGGITTVIANPDRSGLNTSAQTARMQKFAGEPFGGSSLNLGREVDFSRGEAFTMKVWASRSAPVPVLFKFEGPNPNAQDDDREKTLSHSGGGSWEQLCFDFTGETTGFVSRAITFIFDNGVVGDAEANPDDWTFYFDEIEQVARCPGDGGDEPFSRITFDDPAVTYALRGFGGAEDSTLQPDPTDAGNQVVRVNRSGAAETFAGTVVSTAANESVGVIPLDAANTRMSVRVYAPAAGITVRLKIENASDDGISVETETPTTVANGWETLVFDFLDQAPGTAAFNQANTYNKVVIFFNFGTTGADAGAQTFYFDDIDVFTGDGGGGTPTTVDFEGDPASFDFGPDGGFGGGVSTVIANPDPSGINTSGQVVRMQKFAGEVFGGSTLALPAGVDWSQGETFTMKVWSQRTVPVRFKLENEIQELNDTHDGGSQWQELCFDFTGTTGGAAVTGISIFFDIGVVGDAAADPDNWTFYYDEIQQSSDGCPAPPAPAFETITFDDAGTTYTLTDFGGNLSTVTNDPAGGTNQVAQVVKSGTAELWAGTTVSTLPDDAVPRIPLTDGATRMSVRVYSPDAGIPVRLKIENASDGNISVETEAVTTAVNTWETLVFDFADQVAGTAAFNAANTYSKMSIFFNFGTTGAAAGEKTYYFDDVGLAAAEPAFTTITFDDAGTTYTLNDFGGNLSTVTNDPAGGTNQVVQAVKSGTAELWAGTTVSTLPGDAVPRIPLTAGATRMSVRVYSPDAGIPVRLKVEDASNPAISVETEAVTTAVNTWETLVFDFADQVAGTPAFDPANTYDKVSIFFNFGTDGATAGEKTYFFDDVGMAAAPPAFETITFDDAGTTYTLTDFGGNASTVTNDPVGGANQVVQAVKSGTAELWAGTTVSTLAGNAVPRIPLAVGSARMSVRVYSPDAGIPVRLKIEDASDPGISVETEATTTAVNTWETLVFDFAGQVAGTPAFNAANTYSKVSIFFNFGTTGAAAGEKTYYFDDVGVGGGTGGLGSELAVNGGFEAGDLSGWDVFLNNGTITPDNTQSSSGTWSAHVVAGPTQNPVLKQTRLAAGVVNPGDTVNISFDMKGTAVAGGVIFPELISEAAGGGSTGQLLETIASPTADWTTYSYTPAAGADVGEGITFQLAVVCGGDPGCSANVFIDNVSITIAP